VFFGGTRSGGIRKSVIKGLQRLEGHFITNQIDGGWASDDADIGSVVPPDEELAAT
jgi:hypothetical protein